MLHRETRLADIWGISDPMSALDRYVFRTTFGAFLLVLISLTTVIWLTHALREIDLMTNQRQTVLVFLGITGLLIPMLVLVIAPIATVRGRLNSSSFSRASHRSV